MKSPFLLSLLALFIGFRFCAGSGWAPGLPYDRNTIHSCIEWYDNDEGKTCEQIRDYFKITPEQFSEWNPSIGLDCKPWKLQSYCIVTLERVATDPPKPRTTKPTTTFTPTPSTTALGPSPAAWTHLGCYVDANSSLPVLVKRVSKEGGDAALTIPKCEDACYRARFEFAGVKEGNECWCSSFVAGEWARNQTDCNTPCSGDKTKMCGSKDLINVFAADWENTSEVNEDVRTEVDGTTKVEGQDVSGTTKVEGEVVSAHSSSSGSMRYRALFQ
ncbi:hypothetical protein CEP53_000991 [Fusarium sp. AF-6]|nr:hypothetical protein CEP53_000991 [Fusarium sp. AF-6]